MQKEEYTHHAHPPKQVFIKTENGYYAQIIDDIMYITSEHNCITFHTVDGKTNTCSATLDFYEEQLLDYYFVRIHHGTLVNLDYFKEYHKGRGGNVELLDGTILAVSVNGKERLDKITKGTNHKH